MKILITGDSHTATLNRGLRQAQESDMTNPDVNIRVRPLGGGNFSRTPFYRDEGNHAKIIEPTYKKQFKRMPPSGADLDAVVLSMPLWPIPVQYQLSRENLALAEHIEGRSALSTLAFKALVLDDQKYILGFIDVLKRSGVTVAVVSQPGLFRDHPTVKLLPDGQALKCFEAYRAIVISELEKRSVSVIDIPEQCRDTDGFMLQKFRHEDPEDKHHANASFGALMIAAVETWATSSLA